MKNLGIIITNAIKVAGLVAGLFSPHGVFSPHPEAAVIAFSGFMMAGAQLSEQTILAVVERFLGKQTQPEILKETTAAGEGRTETK